MDERIDSIKKNTSNKTFKWILNRKELKSMHMLTWHHKYMVPILLNTQHIKKSYRKTNIKEWQHAKSTYIKWYVQVF